MIDKYLVEVKGDNGNDFAMVIKRLDIEDFIEVMVGNGKVVTVITGTTDDEEED